MGEKIDCSNSQNMVNAEEVNSWLQGALSDNCVKTEKDLTIKCEMENINEGNNANGCGTNNEIINEEPESDENDCGTNNEIIKEEPESDSFERFVDSNSEGSSNIDMENSCEEDCEQNNGSTDNETNNSDSCSDIGTNEVNLKAINCTDPKTLEEDEVNQWLHETFNTSNNSVPMKNV